LWLYEDQAGVAGLPDVIAVAEEFHSSNRAIKSSQVSSSVFWIRLDVENAGKESGSWILSLNRVLLKPAAIYLVTSNETQFLLENTPESFQRSYQEYQTLAGHFSLGAGEVATLYVRYRGANWSGIQPLLFEDAAFHKSQQLTNIVFLLLSGAVASLILLGSIAFMYLGRQIFLLYAIARLGSSRSMHTCSAKPWSTCGRRTFRLAELARQ
jgi:hypothetical protein